MLCQYVKRGGASCQNKPIPGLKRCHLKAHHEDKEEYKETIDREIMLFNNKTMDPDVFNIYNIPPDGACLFRSIAQGLAVNLNNVVKNDEFEDLLLDCQNLISKTTVYSKHYSDKMLNYESETFVAKYLQEIAMNWLCDNADKELIEGTGHTVKDSVLETHDLRSMEQYRSLYSIFSGDPDFVMVKTNKKNRLGVNIYRKEYISDRWGSYPEQYALSQIFGVRIIVYVPRRFSTAQCKILKDNNLKRARLYEYAISEPKTITPKTPTINLILFERPKTSHYGIGFVKA